MDRNAVKVVFLFLLVLAALSLLPTPAGYEFYWWNKATYERHVGLNACRMSTGAFAGRVIAVSLRNGRWQYVFPSKAVSRIFSSTDGRIRFGTTYVTTPEPARLFHVTAGRCPDERP
jgi:hypothetical protein